MTVSATEGSALGVVCPSATDSVSLSVGIAAGYDVLASGNRVEGATRDGSAHEALRRAGKESIRYLSSNGRVI